MKNDWERVDEDDCLHQESESIKVKESFHQCFPFCGSRLALLRKEINTAECLVNFFPGVQSIENSSKLSRFINISINYTKQLVHYNVEQNAPAYWIGCLSPKHPMA